jgi:hypothetical protein
MVSNWTNSRADNSKNSRHYARNPARRSLWDYGSRPSRRCHNLPPTSYGGLLLRRYNVRNHDMASVVERRLRESHRDEGSFGISNTGTLWRYRSLRDRWWAADYGKRLVHAILPILHESKKEWAELVQRSWTAVASDQSSQNTPLPGH